MFKPLLFSLLLTSSLTACSLAPDFELPEMKLPQFFKEESTGADSEVESEYWQAAKKLEKEERGEWWKLFGDETLNDLEQRAIIANQNLEAAAARLQQSRALAEASVPSILPNFDIGANAVRTQPSTASQAAFGNPNAALLNPYTMYSAQGVISYEADIFGRVHDNYRALVKDAGEQEALYRSTLLTLQADVAQHYYALRALDAERALLRETIAIREEAARIMGKRYEAGIAGEQDNTRTQGELASVRAGMIALDRRRAVLAHALAVLVGEMPSTFAFDDMPLEGVPPAIPAGLPSSLLQRRPDVTAAIAAMEAANARIGVARSAFFPRLLLTASGGFESVQLSDLFLWSSRTWALGQAAGSALTMPIFDSGRNRARLDVAQAAYAEALANYRQQVLVAFRDVEDNLSEQRLLAQQSQEQDNAAKAASRTTQLVQKRYDEGDVNYFEVVNAQRDSLAAQQAAVQTRGQRFATTIALIRALGGGFETEPKLEALVAKE